MMHSGEPDATKQCAMGYAGPSCENCASRHWSDPNTGRCISCGVRAEAGKNEDGGDAGQGQELTEALVPLASLLGGLLLAFLLLGGAIFLIQKKKGGTLHGGMSRAGHFVIYVIILLQTTLYVSNTATKEVIEEFALANAMSGQASSLGQGTNSSKYTLGERTTVVSSVGLYEAQAAEFVTSVYASITVFQLDFSTTVQLTCMNAPPLLAEKAFTWTMVVVLLIWYSTMAIVFVRLRRQARGGRAAVVPRSGIPAGKPVGILAGSSGGVPGGEPPKTPKYIGVLHRVTILCVVTYAVSCRVAIKQLYCPPDDVLAECHLLWTEEAPLMVGLHFLVALHIVLFPIVTVIAASAVHIGVLGGSCCRDSEDTKKKQLGDARFPVRVAQWRYVIEKRHFMMLTPKKKYTC